MKTLTAPKKSKAKEKKTVKTAKPKISGLGKLPPKPTKLELAIWEASRNRKSGWFGFNVKYTGKEPNVICKITGLCPTAGTDFKTRLPWDDDAFRGIRFENITKAGCQVYELPVAGIDEDSYLVCWGTRIDKPLDHAEIE